MKVVLTGSTGFLGSEVLKQCVEIETIESIIVLTRRPVDMSNPKVLNIVMKDFRQYDSNVVDAIANADGCIWCLGGTAVDIEVDYPMAFVEAVRQTWFKRQRPFRYVHCSGILAERDQDKQLWFLQAGRRAKGLAETKLTDIAHDPQQRDLWQTYIMRPSMILPKQPTTAQNLLARLLGSVSVDSLAYAAITLATQGTSSTTLENKDLVELGKY